MTDPLFTELQAVRPKQPEPDGWQEGIIVDSRWEEAGKHWRTGESDAARWTYEIQIDHSDVGELQNLGGRKRLAAEVNQ